MPTWNPTSGNNYNLAANWDTAAVPTTTTDAIFDGSVSNADCIVNTAPLFCLNFKVINGYSGTITFNFDLNLYGNYEVDAASATSWTFSAPATAGLLFRVSATIDIPTTRVDSNIGMSILTSGVSIILTLARDTTIANFKTLNNPNTNVSFTINRTSPGNGDNLYVTGNFTHTVFTGTGTFGGTTTVNFTTSTTSTLSITSAGLASDVVFNGTGTFTGTFAPGAGNTTTYTSGDTTGLTLFLVRSATIISNGTTWNNVDFRPVNSQTLTIDTDLIYGGVLSAFTSFRWDISHASGSVIRCRGTGFNTANLRNADVIIETALPCTVSLSNQNDNMDLTFNPFPGGQITWLGGLFIGTSTLTYLTSNGGPVPIASGGIALNPNSITTFDTSPGSSNYIVFGNLTSTSNATMILVSDLHFNGTLLKGTSNVTVNTSTGAKLILGGSTNTDSGNLLGTATVQLGYTGTWNNAITIQNDLLISPITGETVTIQTIRKGLTTKSITYTSGGGTLNSTASNLTTIGAIVVPMLTSGMTWNNITISVGSTLQLDEQLNVSGTLTCSGNATFTGSFGFTTNIFSAQTAASVLTFQNIDANPLAEYRITGNLTIIGTALSRITLQSSGGALFTGTANGTSLTYASGTIPTTGMTISQRTGQAPAGLLSLFPNRPVINGGVNPNFTLDLNVTPTTGSILMRAGYKAVFILENNGVATQNVAYTTCQDIDSGLGQPILSFASNNDDQTTNVSLYRTINWGSLDPPPVQGRNYASVYVY